MKIVNSKIMSCEEEVVEYNTEEEYVQDLDKRRKSHWTRVNKPNFETGKLEAIVKRTNDGKIVQRYKRYNGLTILDSEYR